MKSKLFGVIVCATMGLSALVSSSAMATTFEVGGVVKTSSISPELSLPEACGCGGTHPKSAPTQCTTSTLKSTDSTAVTGTTVSGPVNTMSWSNCFEGNPTVDAAGTLSVERIGTTTNGTVRSSGAKFTLPSFFGNLTCTTSNTDIGKLTGVSSGSAKLDINAVFSCTVVGSIVAEGIYVVTNPSGLGVSS